MHHNEKIPGTDIISDFFKMKYILFKNVFFKFFLIIVGTILGLIFIVK
jgi:hypothetical protein